LFTYIAPTSVPTRVPLRSDKYLAHRSGRRFIRNPKRKELPFTTILDASVPFFGQSALAINRVRLTEKRPFAKI
jgi:hypothetical protein